MSRFSIDPRNDKSRDSTPSYITPNREAEPSGPGRGGESGRCSNTGYREAKPRTPEPERPRLSDPRTRYQDRNREYSLRDSEIQTLIELGKFRVIPAEDLARLAYRGDRSRMETDLQNLRRQSLIEPRSIEGHESYSTRVLTLTKEGHKLLSRGNFVPENQAIYHGFVKPKEARHDADLYRLYHKVAREIERTGGKIRRAILDYELKKDLYRALSRVRADKDLSYERINIANQYDLKVVDDKIPVPDLRIEYEDRYRERVRLDLEIATGHYRPQGLAEKARAGFRLFARQEDHARLRRILNDREITARIFAL